MKRFQLLLATLLALALIAAACGSDSDDAAGGDTDTTSTTEAEEPAEIPATVGSEAPPTTEAEEPVEDDSGPVSGGTLVLANQTGPTTLNANSASGTATAIPSSQLFASPVMFDADYNVQPYLAESWEFSEDGLSLTLNLADAVFHDGEPIKSSDVAFSIDMNQKLHPFKPMFSAVASVDTPDDRTAVINLSKPHPALLVAMSPGLLPIYPEHVYGEALAAASAEDNFASFRSFAGNTDPSVLVGSGPFTLDEFDATNAIVRLKRFDDFFLGAAYLDEVVIQTIADEATRLIALEAGDVHISNVQGVSNLARANEIESLAVTPEGFDGLGVVVSVQFNLEDEVLSNKQVRQAIAYAIDTDFIVDTLHEGLPFRAKSPIHPGSPFYDDSIEGYDFDLEKAAELLDAAGYPADADGSRGIALTMDYLPTAADYQKNLAEFIKPVLGDLGIDMEIRSSPDFGTYLGYLAPRDYDMTMQILFMWGDPVIGVNRSFQEANIVPVPFANNSAYINPELEGLLDQAGSELDIATRTDLYAQAQAILAEDLPFYWLETLPTHSVYNEAAVQNPPLSIWGSASPLHEVWLAE